jgi:16S rRNA (cytidine1402-2'-O)-methyltransferase
LLVVFTDMAVRNDHEQGPAEARHRDIYAVVASGREHRGMATRRQHHGEAGATGLLVLAGTPIGDITDAAPRLAAELSKADVVAAEDTRRLRRLCAALGVTVSGTMVSYFEGNEATRTAELIQRLRDGARVVLVTDAGMPSVSDPGYRLVSAAVAAHVRVTAVPGPSAVLTALALSGLPADRFCFEGFLPRKAGERSSRLGELKREPRTLVFFEAPHRLAGTLEAMAEAFGHDRRAAVCRELTKTYEEVRRGTLDELSAWAAGEVRGEITVVVAGSSTAAAAHPQDLVSEVLARVAEGARLKDAVAAIATSHGVSKRDLYDLAVAARDEGG